MLPDAMIALGYGAFDSLASDKAAMSGTAIPAKAFNRPPGWGAATNLQ